MKVMERCIQRVKPGKFKDFLAIEKKFEALEAKMGNVPTKKRYWSAYGGLQGDTNVWEREWDNMAAIDTYNSKTMFDPEWNALSGEAADIFFDGRFELYYSFTLDEFPDDQ